MRLESQAPVRPHQRHDRLPDLRGRQVAAAGAHSVERERLDPIRVPGRDRGRQLASLRGAEQAEPAGAHRVGHRQRRSHLAVEREVDVVPVGQAAAGLVVADHGEPLRQVLDKGAERVQFQLPAQVRDPAGVDKQRRTCAGCRVGDAARGVLQYLILGITRPGWHPSRRVGWQ